MSLRPRGTCREAFARERARSKQEKAVPVTDTAIAVRNEQKIEGLLSQRLTL